MSNIELLPISELFAAELREFADATNAMIANRTVRNHLNRFLLRGVVKRHHGTPEESFQSVSATAAAMRRGEIGAYAVAASRPGQTSPDYVGSATLQSDLPLRVQPFGVSPKIARIAPAALRLSKVIEGVGTNAVAWVDPRRQNPWQEFVAAQSSVCEKAESGDTLWRIVPESVAFDGSGFMDRAMLAAGFGTHNATGSAHYDDLEVGWGYLPSSELYTRIAQ